MKIFNWVHRKFNTKDGLLGRNVNKDELKDSNENNTGDAQILLEDASFAHMLDSWKGGILTIGTFGFDPLKDECGIDSEESLEEEYSVESEECEITVATDELEEREELYPLIYASALTNEQDHMIESRKGNEIMVIESNNSEKDKKLKRERITLADLFSADSDHNQNLKDSAKTKEEIFYTMKPSPPMKNGPSFAKKFIPRVKEDSRSMQKLQQLMTRVLKRKVHPHIESKSGKNNSQVKAASMLGLSCGGHVRVKSLSLLETDQVATA